MTCTRRRFTLLLALLAAVAMLLGVEVGPAAAMADPTPAPSGNDGAPAQPGNEGGTPLLRDVLESTGRGYVEAKNAVDNSRKRQLELSLELQKVDERLAALGPEISEVAANAYRTGRIGPVTVLLNSSSPDNLLQRAEGLDVLAMHDNQKLRELNNALREAQRAKNAIDAEVAEQQKQMAIMTKQKQEAERALQLVGGKSTGGFVSATSPVARPAPRNPDGSWPKQSCSQNDPTTSGCITPRMLHALKETQRLGFTRFASCYRPSGPWEHPKGRACDFSVERRGFGGDATGGDRLYGNNVAAFLVRNADRLGVLYVIWYRQIWFPATGWRSYGAAYGDPSSDHTNHVHLSVL
jgi:peptidoglycan DL-endopeptidase CwlO